MVQGLRIVQNLRRGQISEDVFVEEPSRPGPTPLKRAESSILRPAKASFLIDVVQKATLKTRRKSAKTMEWPFRGPFLGHAIPVERIVIRKRLTSWTLNGIGLSMLPQEVTPSDRGNPFAAFWAFWAFRFSQNPNGCISHVLSWSPKLPRSFIHLIQCFAIITHLPVVSWDLWWLTGTLAIALIAERL